MWHSRKELKCINERRIKQSSTSDVFSVSLFLEGYVVLRLCCLLWYKVEEIRALIGMCESTYRLRKHPFFLASRPSSILSSYCLASINSCEFHLTPFGMKCLFIRKYPCTQTVFINCRINKGVFRFSAFFDYGTRNLSVFKIGICPSNLVNLCSNAFLGDVDGSCCFSFFKAPDNNLCSGVCGADVDLERLEYKIQERSLVSLEVDVSARILYFFVDEVKIPIAISHIHVPLYIGISGYWGQSFIPASFCRLPTISPSSAVCKPYSCRTVMNYRSNC